MKLLIYFCCVVIMVSVGCSSNKKAGSAEAYAYTYKISSTDPSHQAFLQTHFDKVMLCVDPASKIQILKWETLTEKYYLLTERGETCLIIDDNQSVDVYTGPDLNEILPQFDYFHFDKEKSRDTMHNGIECVSFPFTPGNVGDQQLFRKGESNKLPFFPKDLGTPLQFYVRGCNQKYILMSQENSFVPKASDFEIPPQQGGRQKASRMKSDFKLFVHGNIRDKATNIPIGNSHVLVWRGGLVDTLVVSDCDGKYSFALEGPAVYNLYYRSQGMADKWIQLDVSNAPEVVDEYDMELDGTLFAIPAGCNYKFDAEPVAIARYFPDFEDIQFDFEHTERVAAKLDSVLNAK